MKVFSKIAPFLQNQFTKKLITKKQYVQLILVFILKKLNFKNCGETFYIFRK